MNQAVEYFVTDVGWQSPIGLPVARAVEVLTLTVDEICPMPVNFPAVLGITGWRGQLLWTIALDAWLSLPVLEPSLTHHTVLPALVLQDLTLGRTLACVVHKLHGIETIVLDTLDPLPSDLPESLKRHLCGKDPRSNLLILEDRHLFNPQAWV